VKAKFGVCPERVIDKLALMGDSSDNVPGVPESAPRRPTRLLEQFGSFEGVFEGTNQISSANIRQKIEANRDWRCCLVNW